MLSLDPGLNVYLACGSTDLRKSIDGLAVLVSQVLELDLFSGSLFVFCNKSRDKVKILVWDTNGFWLYYRRLETGRFRWPETAQEAAKSITRRQLQWLLDGLTLEQQQAHAPLTARLAV
jgi:transposase